MSTSVKQFKKKPDDREKNISPLDIQHRIEYYFKIFLNLGIFAIFTSPFVVYFEVLYPFTVPKALWIQSINWIVLLVYMIGIMLNKNLYQTYKPKLNFIFYLYLGYILLYFISSMFGENFTRSFWSDFQRMTGLYWHIHTLIIFFLLSGILNKPKHFYILFTYIFFGGIVLSIFYIFEFYSIYINDEIYTVTASSTTAYSASNLLSLLSAAISSTVVTSTVNGNNLVVTGLTSGTTFALDGRESNGSNFSFDQPTMGRPPRILTITGTPTLSSLTTLTTRGTYEFNVVTTGGQYCSGTATSSLLTYTLYIDPVARLSVTSPKKNLEVCDGFSNEFTFLSPITNLVFSSLYFISWGSLPIDAKG